MWFTLTVVVLGLGAVISIVWTSWRNGISPMPASALVRQAVANEVKRLQGTGTIVEAGSGWGTLGIHLAKHCQGWRVVGVENSPVPLHASQLLARLHFGVDAKAWAAFRRGNIYSWSYTDTPVVVCYLYPGAMQRLSPILSRQLAPGARVISVCFALPGWTPERVVTCRDLYRTKVYVYHAK
ncbi:SAM-dependent methyltransferase [Brevibacillus invocatus]|uniref:SAM-dependent methyltransferase n=1 Tax=Brevibacillus invocatus TaxID=173959 RepID=UPI00203F51B3|nr:class I SAM-dependent methyltransferase [Brevibacillus invocatus]MCM3079413.1 class I SAM-dependent methyltransferase [Brevibacillus invocatus]MCM3429535.1 class I SAM-dependent methyltransferase [Brevibacillus invocatus]